MKLFIMSCLGLLSIWYQQNISIYSITCTKADGTALPLQNYKGKKALFVILPLADDTAYYNGLVTFQQKYQDSINIICVPVAEMGFDSAKVYAIATSIAKPNTVVLGLTYIASDTTRSLPLIEWLTQRGKSDQNHINNLKIGQKYFIDEIGTMYAKMGSSVPFDAPVLDRIVRRPRPFTQSPTPSH